MTQPLVSICCITYNHELYIKKAIEGFLMQKTTFPIEIIIHDDASTDKTAEIIKGYADQNPNVIVSILQIENQYSKGLGFIHKFVYSRARGKYFAVCEGDDYWTDPLKLQKQVDFLEKNPGYDLVYGNQLHLELNGQYYPYIPPKILSFEDLLKQNSIPTATTCFRKTSYDKYRLETNQISDNWLLGDYPLWLWICQSSKIKHLNDFYAIYRRHEGSATDFGNFDKGELFFLSVIDIKTYYYSYYNGRLTLNSFIKREHSSLFTLSIKYHKLLKSIKYFPYNPLENVIYISKLISHKVFK